MFFSYNYKIWIISVSAIMLDDVTMKVKMCIHYQGSYKWSFSVNSSYLSWFVEDNVRSTFYFTLAEKLFKSFAISAVMFCNFLSLLDWIFIVESFNLVSYYILFSFERTHSLTVWFSLSCLSLFNSYLILDKLLLPNVNL